jgi:hypothetical protein
MSQWYNKLHVGFETITKWFSQLVKDIPSYNKGYFQNKSAIMTSITKIDLMRVLVHIDKNLMGHNLVERYMKYDTYNEKIIQTMF